MRLAPVMLALAVAAAAPPALSASASASVPSNPEKLATLVAQVRSADYRGDRPALARLEAELSRIPDGTLSEYRDYWRGFALWRRAMNGFNETPTPDDLVGDLENAVSRFQSSLDRHPEWIEARLAMVGCWGNLIFLAGKDADRRAAILEKARPTFRWVMANAGDNPRALWIRGGMEFAAPPPTGGDFAKAAATLEHGVACAWREAGQSAASAPWVPSWGGPENMMNLAYMYSHSPAPDRALALAYANGALVAVPEWHYVRDVLLPQIQALPAGTATGGGTPASPPAPAPHER